MVLKDNLPKQPNVPIYFMHIERDGLTLLSVPCEFEDIDLDKFQVVTEGDKPCPYNKTMKCPLCQYKMMIEGTKAGCN